MSVGSNGAVGYVFALYVVFNIDYYCDGGRRRRMSSFTPRPIDRVCVHCTVQRYVREIERGVLLRSVKDSLSRARAWQGRRVHMSYAWLNSSTFVSASHFHSDYLHSRPSLPSFNSAAAAGRSWQFDMHKSRVVVKVESIIPSSSLFCLFVHVTLLYNTHTDTHT